MEPILIIITGLLGLGILVFVHELGHFLVAKAVGIEVEAFALGWGKPILKKMYKGTEYRISMFPVGGYCKMKGEIGVEPEDSDSTHLPLTESDEVQKPVQDGSMYSVSAWRRILTYLGGPLFNLIFAILIFAIIGMVGYSYPTYSNKIVVDATTLSPAVIGGLETGDTIVAIEGNEVSYFDDIRNMVIGRALMETEITVDRNGEILELMVVPELNSSGAATIGLAAWVDPYVGDVTDTTYTTLQQGDRIVSIENTPIAHSTEMFSVILQELQGQEEFAPYVIDAEVERDGMLQAEQIYADWNNGWTLGFSLQPIIRSTKDMNFFQAVGYGVRKTFETLTLTVRGLGNLFRGADVREALSGPIQITYMLGDVAVSGLQQGFGQGVRMISEFIALISIALAFGNLLPIPALDGGQICIGMYEGIRKRRVSAKIMYRMQLAGFLMLFGILFFTLWNDLTRIF